MDESAEPAREVPRWRTYAWAVLAVVSCPCHLPLLAIAAKNLLAGKDKREVDYPPIPSVVFTLPSLASVGLSEAAARDQGLDFDIHLAKTEGWYSSLRVGDQPTESNGGHRARAMDERDTSGSGYIANPRIYLQDFRAHL